MKVVHRNLGIVLFLVFSFSAMAQTPPAGTVRLKPSKTGVKHATYMDKTEVTAQYWLEFLWWTGGKYGENSPKYTALLPDSMICLQVYSSYPQYRNYPMVGISYEQAIAYCKWRSDRINEWLELQKNKKKYGYTVTYSLPTETDLEEAYKQQKIKTNCKKLTDVVEYKCKYKKEKIRRYRYKKEKTTCKPKNNNLADIADNAQELTAEKTVITGENAGKLIFEPYQGANAMTGFRCVAEIELIKK